MVSSLPIPLLFRLKTGGLLLGPRPRIKSMEKMRTDRADA